MKLNSNNMLGIISVILFVLCWVFVIYCVVENNYKDLGSIFLALSAFPFFGMLLCGLLSSIEPM